MKPTLDAALCRKFPLLYRRRGDSIYDTCMGWGFECGEGWFALIHDLSARLEPLIAKLKAEGMPDDELPCAAQVKEKFGTLRFYMNFETREMSDLISEAENLSGKVCEVCGSPGKRRGEGWVATRCETHR